MRKTLAVLVVLALVVIPAALLSQDAVKVAYVVGVPDRADPTTIYDPQSGDWLLKCYSGVPLSESLVVTTTACTLAFSPPCDWFYMQNRNDTCQVNYSFTAPLDTLFSRLAPLKDWSNALGELRYRVDTLCIWASTNDSGVVWYQYAPLE